MSIYSELYFEQNSGILLYSLTKIYEIVVGDPSRWLNHTFERQLDEFTEFEEAEDTKGNNGSVILDEFFYSYTLPFIILSVIGITTLLAVWRIRHAMLMKQYQEYKASKRNQSEPKK